MSTLSHIVADIRSSAKGLGMKDAELARAAGITPEAFSRLVRAKGARFGTIEELAAAVGCRLALVPVEAKPRLAGRKPYEVEFGDRYKLLMHRIVARALRKDPSLIAKAWAELMRQKNRGEDPERIKEWERILSLPIPALTQKITERSETMDRLRLSSPLAFVVDFTDLEQRRRLLRIAKRGVLQHG